MLALQAPAKVNLALCVGPCRPDGYHELATIFHTVALADDVRLAPAEASGLTVEAAAAVAAVPDTPRNLAWRALILLEEQVGRALPTHIHLLKRIPPESGLGGGSSDAAAVLVGLNRLWKLGLTESELRVCGSRLGADVPFFVLAQSGHQAAWATGVGEVLAPLPAAGPAPLLLVRPQFGLATPDVYRQLDALRPQVPPAWRQPAHDWVQVLRQGLTWPGGRAAQRPWPPAHNDLAPAASRLLPALSELWSWLEAHGAMAWALSGSGSATWVLPPPEGGVAWCTQAAEQARERGWWSEVSWLGRTRTGSERS